MANPQTDIQFNGNGDLLIQGGDLVTGLSDYDHIQSICESAPGNWKQYPLVGVNLPNDLQGPFSATTLRSTIQLGLQADGFNFIDIQGNPGGRININATR